MHITEATRKNILTGGRVVGRKTLNALYKRLSWCGKRTPRELCCICVYEVLCGLLCRTYSERR